MYEYFRKLGQYFRGKGWNEEHRTEFFWKINLSNCGAAYSQTPYQYACLNITTVDHRSFVTRTFFHLSIMQDYIFPSLLLVAEEEESKRPSICVSWSSRLCPPHWSCPRVISPVTNEHVKCWEEIARRSYCGTNPPSLFVYIFCLYDTMRTGTKTSSVALRQCSPPKCIRFLFLYQTRTGGIEYQIHFGRV
jgi:hypothetical protein